MDKIHGAELKYYFGGKLDFSNKKIKQGYVSWANQKSKCYNKRNPDYKYYGKKGITVEYSSREFVGWWLLNLKKRKWKSPTVGRLDHSKGYYFENIEMQEALENTRERIRRCGRPEGRQSKKILVFKDDIPFFSSRSANQAALVTKKPTSTVCRICNGKNGLIQTVDGYKFKYYEDLNV